MTRPESKQMDNKRKLLLSLLKGVPTTATAVDAIAIVGVAGRYPQANNVGELWSNLVAGRDCIREVPSERWAANEHFDPSGANGSYSKWAGFLDDVDKFDPLFFQISPADAQAMDPQERLFLETAVATLDDAGYPPARLAERGPVGVFVGVMNSNYEWMAGEASALGVATDAHSNHWSIANRVSYCFDFTGPSMAIDTACSASLTAIHLACESLRSGECNAAIAGGVNLILHPMHLQMLSRRGMISREARLKSFGEGADGFVDGEGVGAVLLKPLAQAKADRDRILAVIRGSAINAGGKTGGYTVPSAAAQSEVIQRALRRGAIPADTIGYVEAHGTGTPLGDPIEVAGLVDAFNKQSAQTRNGRPPVVALGSVKSNIGHLESAAGIAGLTKVLLQIRHQTLVPSLHSASLNPKIAFSASPFSVQQLAEPWQRLTRSDEVGRSRRLPLRAIVSSFGGGGANACIVVEEPEEIATLDPVEAADHLLVLSAKTEESLKRGATNLAAYMRASMDQPELTNCSALDESALAHTRRRCVQLASQALDIDPAFLEVDADLLECGFGLSERARFDALVEAEFGQNPAASMMARTIEEIARAIALAQPPQSPQPRGVLRLADVAHTLQSGRPHFEFRIALVASSIAQAAEALDAYAGNADLAELLTGHVKLGRVDPSDVQQAKLEQSLTRRDLHAISELWVQGIAIDWDRITPRAARRVELPSYAFARKRYWIPCATQPERRQSAAAASEDGLVEFYRPQWVRSPYAVGGSALPAGDIVCLVTRASQRLGEAIAARCQNGQVRVLRIDELSTAEWAGQAAAAHRVYHLGAAFSGATTMQDLDDLPKQMQHGSASLLALLRSPALRQVVVVTTDVYAVAGSKHCNPLAAGMHGLLQVAPKERTELSVLGVDVASAEFGTDAELQSLVDLLLDAPLVGGARRSVALRNGVFHDRALGKVKLPEPGPVFRDRGVYLLIGGTGGIAKELSVHLAQRHGARLVWLSRSELDAAALAVQTRIQASGGVVAHVRGDVCSHQDVARAVAEAHERFGALHGVIHAAMVFDNRSLADLDETTFAAATRAKIQGAAAAGAATADQHLDFLCFFSSAGSFGSFAGNGAYICASATEDALALWLRERLPFPVVVINQGYWGQTGSGAAPGLAEIFAGLGITPFSAAAGVAAMQRILSSGMAQLMPIRANRRALEAMGHDPSLDSELPAGHRPTLATVAANVRDAVAAPPAAHNVLRGYDELEAACSPMLLSVYQQLGVFQHSAEQYERRTLGNRLGLLRRFERLHEALLNILVDAGYLAVTGDRVQTTAAVQRVQPADAQACWEAELDRLVAAHPEIEPTITLNKRFLLAYPRILKGEVGATEIMFPGASMDLVQNFYKGNPLTDTFNHVVRETVRRFAEFHSSGIDGAGIVIVELGAGTGATTEWILPELAKQASEVRYVFTDISPRFLEFGRERFAQSYPFTDFKVLNLEHELVEQGFALGSADVVLATNVMHATTSLRASLRKAKALLRPGGWLVLNELTATRPLLTLGGGVLEGWWSFEDEDLRLPDSPLASPTSWTRVCLEEGFGVVRTFDAGDEDLGQTVIVAESDGLVRQQASSTRQTITHLAPRNEQQGPQVTATRTSETFAEQLHGLVRRVLQLDERIDPDQPLASYGFDSLNGMKIVAAVDEAFGVAVPLGDFFEHATLRELTRHLSSQWSLDSAPAPRVGDGLTARARAETNPRAAALVLRPRVDTLLSTHPLSEGQRALWIIEQVAPGNYAYNLPLALWMRGDLDVLALRVTLQHLVDRHPELRACIRANEGEPVVNVAAEPELPFQQVFMMAVEDDVVVQRMSEDLRRPFDMSQAPLMRATLFTLADERHALLLTFHHIVFDGVSIARFVRELEHTYRDVSEGRELSAESPAHTFAEFAQWQRQVLESAEGDRLRNYWLDRLRGRRRSVTLPFDRPRPIVPEFHGASLDGQLPAPVLERARELASAERTSLFSVLLAGYFALLHRYADQSDIVVGTPTAGRPSGYESVLGYFMNMVVISESVDGDDRFRDLVRRIHRANVGALEHGAYPLIKLSEALKREDPTAPAVPFNVAFYFQNWVREAHATEIVMGPVEGVHQEGEFDLTLEIEVSATCRYTLKYDTALFDSSTVERFGRHFVRLLSCAVATPDAHVSQLDLLTPDENAMMRAEASVEYPADALVVQLVRRQAEAHPTAIAVRHRDDHLSYQDLMSRVDALTARLRSAGVGRGRTVGILLPRNLDLPVALLAVQAAGGAYVPLDPTYPAERLSFMTSDAELHLVLTDSSINSNCGAVPRLVVDTDEQPPPTPSSGPASASDAAYVIYTSGSTGRPKGVRVPHRALTNFLYSMMREPGFGPSDTLLALTTICFDISGLELYLPLISGGTVQVLDTEVARDGLRLAAAIDRGPANVVQATPTTWAMLLAAGWRGNSRVTVLCGGEALPPDTARSLVEGCAAVWNLYGPTETTIWSTACRITPDDRVTIGTPIANTSTYVLDSAGRLLPPGVPGELYIGGHGVADGYLNRPELTAERFVPDPFATGGGARMYRTGDLVRRLVDGRIEYLGRMDSQVKVRGFRIELEEVEATLRRLPGVREAVVVARASGATHSLVAYYVLDDNSSEPNREQLTSWLPDHMLPDLMIRVREFPRTLNQKIDRSTLTTSPLPEVRSRFGFDVASLPEAQADATDAVARVVRQLIPTVASLGGLRQEEITAHSPFGDLGMNSVNLTALSVELRKMYGVEVVPTSFYRYTTLVALAKYLLEHHGHELEAQVGGNSLREGAQASSPHSTLPSLPSTTMQRSTDIAVIGMAGRLPGSADLDEFWNHLVAGNDLITEIPSDRWDWRSQPGSRSRWGGFISDVECFDAAFFGISPREAELMDPQQRLILETVWNCIEDAGYRPSDLAGKRVGVFIAVTNSDYLEVQRAAGRSSEGHTLTGAALSIIPNRVSYLLDLRGPSIAVDTACSGSLTAVHLACSALRDGSCELAIAAGVSLMLSPTIYEALSRGEMLSPDGRCMAFDSRANGYVRGEGVGAVLLKPLDGTLRDGDSPHALIKSVAINHGGRTASLTAPNPDAQAELLETAFRTAAVPLQSIGYIEAHGTGTALGDPIESTGLSTAFRRLEGELEQAAPAPCAIGSVKSNIGHLEAAAGIAGMLKVVLALKHAHIPASLHMREENPLLDLGAGRFRVAANAQPWKRAVDPAGNELPRRGGVSSFGFGGANAHVVLEEALPQPCAEQTPSTQLFVLSARDTDALTRAASNLAKYLAKNTSLSSADVAYTLQVGRDALPQRLGVIARTTRELCSELVEFVSGRPSAVRTALAPRALTVTPAVATEDLDTLMDTWLGGATIDWQHIHRGAPRRRVHLPGYSFARTRHWVAPHRDAAPPVTTQTVEPILLPPEVGGMPRLHPTLIDGRASKAGLTFTKTLTGKEFYLEDHVVGGTPVMPGVVYLEMARAAVEAALNTTVRGVDGLVWSSPVRFEAGSRAHELIVQVEDGAFQIRDATEGGALHAHGTVWTGESETPPARVNLEAVRARCSRVRSGAACYEAFSELGFAYGPSFRVIEELAEGRDEVLATLRLPPQRHSDADQYVFHPSMLDAALQTAGTLATFAAGPTPPIRYLPFALDSVRSYERMPQQVFAYATPSARAKASGMLCYDVTLVDSAGEVVAKLDGFTLRSVPTATGINAFEPQWTTAAPTASRLPGRVLLLDAGSRGSDVADVLRRRGLAVELVALRPGMDVSSAAIDGLEPHHVVHLAWEGRDAHAAIEHGFEVALTFLQNWQRERRDRLRYLYVYQEPSQSPANAAMAAFARSVRLEHPSIDFGVLSVAGASLPEAVLDELGSEGDVEVRIDERGRAKRAWRRVNLPSVVDASTFTGPGAHVITGGTGALGLLLAEHIQASRHAAGITTGGIVVAARNAPNAPARARLDALGAQFVQADLAEPRDVYALVTNARRLHGSVSGVLHLAGTHSDALLQRKQLVDAQRVLAAKVHGAVLLDEATRDEPLDYFVAFSSAAAAFGNVGQTDYAFANAFLGHFAQWREAQRKAGGRRGRTFAPQWPLWRDGGMKVDAAVEQYMERVLGMRALSTSPAFEALHRALAGDCPTLLLAPGDATRTWSALDATTIRHQPKEGVPQSSTDAAPRTERLVLQLLSEELKLPQSEIITTEPLDRYGVDSLITIGLLRRLEVHFGPLPATLLFEYVTVRQVAEHLASAFPEASSKLPEVAGEKATPTERENYDTKPAGGGPTESTLGSVSSKPQRARPGVAEGNVASEVVPTPEADDIAIIGVAGRYPGANDVDEYWHNLREGRDSIEEIPAERWAHDRFYDVDKSVTGKTYGKWGGFVQGADRFDPLFFRMSQIEAEHTDPQERVFLETVWHLLEDAGYTRERLRGTRTGVFVGMMYGHYQLYGVQDALRGQGFATSSSYASVANRVSYFFDFDGPSVALDTMCSSSLVTIHQACLAIRNGDCEVAVAGGVNISSHPVKFLQLAQRGFLSEDGRCRSFGEGGTGYVPAEGSGAVLLKRLGHALADRDRVLAVVKSSAVNHGGAGAGYSVPNPKAQGDLVKVALTRAGMRASELDYLEAHGTGTALGDPIEVAGMLRAMKDDLPERLPIGSVKSNIGHAESAAGIAAITKVLMQMRHGELAPSLHSEQLNPKIDFSKTPFHVQRERVAWPRRVSAGGITHPRTAGVSSFGAGGTNAHIILQEYVTAPAAKALAFAPQLAVLSAKDAERLTLHATRLAAHLDSLGASLDPQRPTAADIAWTLQIGREAMEHRVAVVFDDVPQLAARLKGFASGTPGDGVWTGVVDPRKPRQGTPPAPVPAAYATAWTSGQKVDWSALHPTNDARCVALPGYPFSGERVWLPAADAELAALDTTPSEGLMLTKHWVPTAPPSATALPRRIAILILPGTEAIAAAIASRVPEAEVLGIDQLRAEVSDQQTAWDRFSAVVDLAGCVPVSDTHGVLPLWLSWMQQLVDRGRRDIRLLLASSPNRSTGVDAGAARSGLYRMLQSEYRQLRSRHVEVLGDQTDDELCRFVVEELGASDELAHVAYLDGKRHRAALRELPTNIPSSDAPFDGEHVLWITGGTRGIGLLTAQHFVQRRGVKKLVLLGRESLPPQDQWATLIDNDDALAPKLRPLAALVDRGVQLEVLAVPLNDRQAVAQALADTKRRLGPVGGVIHSAGFTDFENPAFVRKPEAGMARVMTPKLDGLDSLVECFAKEPLQLFVVYSSVVASVPALAVGQSDYALANAYLDAVAQARPFDLPIVSIQWPSWKETGMGEVRSAAYHASGLATLTNDQGLALLDRALASGARVVLPAVVRPGADWQLDRLTRSRFEVQGPDPAASRTSTSTPTALPGTDVSALPDGAKPAAQTALASWLLDRLASELRFDRARLAGDVPIHDFGIDSILVSQLVQTVAKRLGVSVDPSALLDHPTANDFASYLFAEHRDAVLAQFIQSATPAASVTETRSPPAKPNGSSQTDATVAASSTIGAQTTPFAAPEVASTWNWGTGPAADPSLGAARETRPNSSSSLVQSGENRDIAVIGVSCRFPGAASAAEYWDLLRRGSSALRPIPRSRFERPVRYHAGLLEETLSFDPDFFLLPDADVAAMDPQALLLLEEVARTISDAGYTGQQLKGRRIGVYIGGRATHTPEMARLDHAKNPVVVTGQNYLSANVSQFFDFRGPSLVVDTACSSPLVALSMAVQAMRANDIDSAIVGGVNLLADDRAHHIFGQRGLLNSGSEFHVFDRRASGIVLSEGVGVVMLKSLTRAREDGDRILAVLKGIAINNDGRTAGPATPNPQAQRDVMLEALAQSGHGPQDVGWIETNGSGSTITDLLELKAIQSIYRQKSTKPVALGSIKPNIGHPLAAEGIAALIKVVLMLHHGEHVPFLSGQQPLEHFDVAASPLYFPRDAQPWPDTAELAAVNCFADGGTNAHVLLGPGPTDHAITRTPLPPPAFRPRMVIRGSANPEPKRPNLFWDSYR